MAVRPLVSVVVPTRNRCHLLARCLTALAAQDYSPFEVVVVDDHSSDETARVLSSFREGSLRLRWLRNDRQCGANPSRNRAIRASEGELIALLDDDCIAEPAWLGRLVAGFVSERVAAVTGTIVDPPAQNIYDLAFRGTHRVHGRTHASRLVGGNLCVRRRFVEAGLDEDRAVMRVDTTVSGRGDEEGLFLRLRAQGYEQRIAPDAIVLHEHHHTRQSFFRQAFEGGRSAARLGYKYHLPLRLELSCLLLGYLLLPASALGAAGLASAAASSALFLVAITYNELWRKRKTVRETIVSGPVVLAYYHVRAAGYFIQLARLWTAREHIQRVALGTPR
ncbi:MAG: glycosyltransferase family 2 protein [Candidatus Binatia bacterium]